MEGIRQVVKILILGSGQVGSMVAQNLAAMPNNDVTIIDIDEAALKNISSQLDVQTIVGNGASPSLMAIARSHAGLVWTMDACGVPP